MSFTVQKIPTNYFFRVLFKVIFKVISNKEQKHNRRLWPYYSIIRNDDDEIEKVFFNNDLIIDQTHRVINTQHNKDLMLIASGPSIKNLPKTFFTSEKIDYMGVNGSISLDYVKFKYYVIIDHTFIMNKFDLVEKILSLNLTLFTNPRCLDLILRRKKIESIQCKIRIIEMINNKKQKENFMKELKNIDVNSNNFYIKNGFGFSKNSSYAIFDYFTVAYSALQIIYSLNYKNIYLAGIDLNNFSEPRFYENKNNIQKSYLYVNSHLVLQAFDVAAQLLEKEKIKVINLSQDSALECFEKSNSLNI